jgi:hypothetical protein
VTFTGYRLEGLQADSYAFATPCCGPRVQRTTSSINAVFVPPIEPDVIPPTPVVLPINTLPIDSQPDSTLAIQPTDFSPLTPINLPVALPYFTTVLPTAYADTGSYYLTKIEPAAEIVPVVVPAPVAPVAPVPYQAPVYAPKQERN